MRPHIAMHRSGQHHLGHNTRAHRHLSRACDSSVSKRLSYVTYARPARHLANHCADPFCKLARAREADSATRGIIVREMDQTGMIEALQILEVRLPAASPCRGLDCIATSCTANALQASCPW